MTNPHNTSLFHQLYQLALLTSLWLVLLPAPALAQVVSDSLKTNTLLADTALVKKPADSRDSYLRKGNLRRGIIMPTILIGAGLLVIDNNLYDRQDARYDLRIKSFPRFNTNIDDYLFFAPAVGLVAFDIFSSQNRHDFRRQIGLLAASGALSSAIMWPMKKVTDVDRPNGKRYAFPSGHTTYAFVVATMVSREFRGKSKWIGIGSYTIASATGVMRILNDAHWLSDVLAGAGVGILSTNLVYLAHDRWFKNKGLNSQLMPTILPNGALGLGMVFHLN
ncbi:phosphatase PAP2 family protein (plasmid) [Adhaeribacter swui]|uniref:Phosphatase PAP2 family protein n=1 Tax=Adhaeribacter swui TaxID=2086471 RepID=A0A7G7G279_9BACT|nr:phosphatase PAP2 family protein [Adhaeribacter swui]QNF31263.1 phosphatase PAP2 family protein [Adhaeribacter swui]